MSLRSLFTAVLLAIPPVAIPDAVVASDSQAAESPRNLLVTSVEDVSLPITASPSPDESSLEEAMALCLGGDIPSCMAARLAVLAACGGTVLLVATPIPGDEVVVYAACHSAFMWWTKKCVKDKYGD